MDKYTNSNSPGNILAIVVIYNMNLSASESINSIEQDLKGINQHLDLLVYDNSLNPTAIPAFEMLQIIKYIHDPSNGGVSKAYNRGVEFAAAMGKKWVLLLDQDTHFHMGIVNAYLSAILLNPDISMFCPVIKLGNGIIFSPGRKKFKRGFTLKAVSAKNYPLKKFYPVNSGLLVKVASFLEVGGYNEKVKLDFSDLQFSERFSSRQTFFKVIDATAIQNFSNDETESAKLNIRFKLFCEDARNCNKSTAGDHIQYFIVVLARAVVLMIRTKNPVFLKTFFSKYLV